MTTQAKVGAIVLAAIIILGVIITWKSTILLKFSGYRLTGSFQDIEGLTTGSEVRYRGFKVGKVIKIDPTPEDIRIYSIINNDIRFPADSSLRVAFDGLVGLKYLEIRPGKSTSMYEPSQILYGKKTSGIVDFVDIAAQNLSETKRILVVIRDIVEKPSIQNAFINAVMNIEKASVEINKLTQQIQLVAESINRVVADRNFQDNVKGTIASTNKTLASANQFFEGFGKLQVKPSADILLGGLQNQIKGNIDIRQNDLTYWRLSLGEGPTRSIALLDLQISSIVAKNIGLRLGMINTHLGGGIDFYPNDRLILSGDIYDFDNPKPANPKIRFTSDYNVNRYVDFLLQADDFLNSYSGNYSVGVRIKGGGD